jgi:molybdopterin molybdotransferase
MPAWADAVVPLEYAVVDDGHLRLEMPVASGTHVRPAGEELAAGDVAIAAGATLTPAGLGLLAALDVTTVSVHRRPRVAILVSGDEVRGPAGAIPAETQIPDANGPMLRALLGVAGADITAMARVADDPSTVENVLRDLAAGADLVITSGGASVGSRDHVVAGVQRIGELLIHQLALRPGRPASFGAVAGTPVVMLPGNPLAALVGFEILARPAIRRLAGARDPFRTAFAVALADVAALPDRWLAIPVRLTGGRGAPSARPVELAGSAMLTGAAAADGLALVPPAPGPATDRIATRTATVELW